MSTGIVDESPIILVITIEHWLLPAPSALALPTRVGRVGLPLGSSDKAVDVNCSNCYSQHEPELKAAVIHAELSHAWYFWSPQFLDDLIYTLRGDLDRNVIPTRTEDSKGEFWLKP